MVVAHDRTSYSAVQWRELGVLVLDGSISMTWEVEGDSYTGTKAEAVNTAVRDMLSRFKISGNSQNFTFAVVKFHEQVTEEVQPTPVTEIDDEGDYDPTSHGTGRTFIGSGLERAGEICEQFFRDHTDDLPTTAVILLMTDGECDHPDQTKAIAEKIRQNNRITVSGAFFATKGQDQVGIGFLRSLCTDPKYFKTVYTPNALRTFWTATMERREVNKG
jgi:hypothetical protein